LKTPPKTYYLAYGSNLHPLRLKRRVSSARMIGTVELPGYAMSFIKRSKDGSAKCTISRSAGDCLVCAALYSIDRDQLVVLDKCEGLGNGYEHEHITVEVTGVAYQAITYIAAESHVDKSLQPYHWYKGFVMAGMEYHGFPTGCMEAIQAIPSVQDPDVTRRRENEALHKELS